MRNEMQIYAHIQAGQLSSEVVVKQACFLEAAREATSLKKNVDRTVDVFFPSFTAVLSRWPTLLIECNLLID